MKLAVGDRVKLRNPMQFGALGEVPAGTLGEVKVVYAHDDLIYDVALNAVLAGLKTSVCVTEVEADHELERVP